ncbi:MAG: protein phosphatase 2C domain-containing protein [Polyangiaceae bacterium]
MSQESSTSSDGGSPSTSSDGSSSSTRSDGTRSSTRVRIEFAQGSDPGRDPNKQVNEDSCGYAETRFGHLCVLCDGMGGHYGGKEASRLAISTIFEVFDQTPSGTHPAVALKASIEEAARRVYRLGGPPENRTRPGSTAVAMVLHDRGVDVAHVGDSRAYVVRSQQIYPLTRDHSMVQGMIDAGLLTEAQAIGHPDANKITRALGMKPDVDVEVRPEPMELFPGDILLLASDGLTDLALAADILAALKLALSQVGGQASVSHACTELIRMANERGGHDNITVQIARVTEVGPKVSNTIPQGPSGATHHGGGAVQSGQAVARRDQAPAPTIQDAVAKTAPDALHVAAGPAHAAPAHAAPAHAAPAHAAGDKAWGMVAPTAVGQTPAPTIIEAGPASSPSFSSGMYQPTGAGHDSAARVAMSPPYSEAAGAPGHAPGVTVMAAPGPTPPMTPPPAPARPSPDDPRAWQMAPAPPSVPFADAQPSRGGVVVVLMMVSAVIAVLIVLLLWAFLLR